MDQLLGFLTWNFLLFCLSLAAITFVARKFVEFYVKSVKELNLWNNLILPVSPIFLGAIIGAFAKMYPYPEGLVSVGGRIIFGLVAGLLSTTVFRVIKTMLKSKNDRDSSTPDEPKDEPVDDKLVQSVRDSIQK